MTLELKAQAREITGKKVRQLRNSGLIPAVLYGHGIKSLSLSIDAKDFAKLFKQTGETTLIHLVLDGKNHNVLIHDLARDPLKGETIHVDFYEVRMDEKIKAKILLVFAGESAAIKAEGGVLVHALQELEIEALPQDLPKEISVDISSLNTFEDKIRVSDLIVGNGVKVLANPDDLVAMVAPPRSDKEMVDLEAKPAEEVGEVKVVGEEKKEAEAVAAPEAEPKAEQKEKA
ncbi:MAG TPA: 50S ribosomal protein L25 [Candidatus Portnoybacteria bacterium]|uniref:Large ribosomal subunit protein bL25 n=1 Tax=Candidatus Portnoybacteria bacterium CG02_land_8_20_14_3_00_45_8 TaxID=1974807 RepID=A0A2M7D6K6_9BACT|nr:MAG: 50S ribosomal protein L25 [Candidatus Portnoybacteria bacterium CG02_land_8_20_14_3_00_45_8]HCX27899.1 50S ribosomal protein L25 [Candidatus Portnoybacteria bacterium]